MIAASVSLALGQFRHPALNWAAEPMPDSVLVSPTSLASPVRGGFLSYFFDCSYGKPYDC